MAFVRVASASSLRKYRLMEGEAGGRVVALCLNGERIRAFSGFCPHVGGPLGQGAIEDGAITCPWHAWQFDCETGANVRNPGQVLESFPVQTDGDDILVDL